MSHIFISYAHLDQPYLKIVLDWLYKARYTEHEIWYDSNIEAGDNWRDEIPEALDSAFAVLVILTKNSVQRPFIIYEWAYALGQGIPVIGLQFEDILSDLLDPLRVKQIEKYHESIPDDMPTSLVRKLHQLKSIAPEVGAINSLIYETIYELHRQFFVLKWIGKDINYMSLDEARNILAIFVRDASEVLNILEKLMLERRYALSGKQYRLCWQLVDVLREIRRIQVEYEECLPERFDALFDNIWLPAFEYFEGDGWWNKRIRRQFTLTVDSEDIQLEIISEITRCISSFYASDAQVIIGNKIIDLGNNQENIEN